MLVSTELTPGRDALVGGVHKRVREPVLVVIPAGEVRDGYLFCDWVITHPGLVPGVYELRDGPSVRIPPALCTSEGRAVHSVTLEVQA